MLKIPDLEIENCALKEEIRFYLCGVYFDSLENVFVATNGSSMAVVPAGDGANLEDSVSGIIPLDFFIDMRKRKVHGFYITKPNKKKPPLVTDSQGRTAQCIDGTFPVWKQITEAANKRPVKFEVCFDVSLLAPLAFAISKKGQIKMSFSSDVDGIVITSAIAGHSAILMPCRL